MALRAAVDRAMQPLLTDHGAPGLAVGVTVDGRRTVFTYGVAAKGGAPVTEDTLFELGSVSKTFTATLAAKAVAAGRIALDDHPGAILPALKGSALDAATVLDLGTYTAGGLPLQFPDAVRNDAGAVAWIADFEPTAKPGRVRQYSNPSIGLLGDVAATAMGGTADAMMQREVIDALGLANTYVRVPEEAMPRYAWGTNRAGDPARVNPGAFDAAAYGVKSTAADMLTFVEANLRPETLDAPMRSAVEGTHVGYFEVGAMVQGLGWEQYPYPVTLERLLAGNATDMAMKPQPATAIAAPAVPEAPTLYNKTGSTNGFGAYVAFVPAEGIGIVMLANRNVPIPARITAAHAVLEELAALAD